MCRLFLRNQPARRGSVLESRVLWRGAPPQGSLWPGLWRPPVAPAVPASVTGSEDAQPAPCSRRLGNRPAPFSAGSARKVLTGATLVTTGFLGVLHCSDLELGEDLFCWERACLSLAPGRWWSDLMGAECLVGAEDEICQICSKRPSAKVFN